MPELPDITLYLEALERRVRGQPLNQLRIANPFVLRTTRPPVGSASGRRVVELRRLGKRIAIRLDGDLWIVLHLMIAGRLQWREEVARLSAKYNLAAFDFPNGTLLLTEAGTKKRASLHLAQGEEALRAHDPGGLDVLGCQYCPGCQTAGKLLADRSLSVLFKKDWPRTPEELEEMRAENRGG